ncbi:MAG: gamma carbonic anhydrase family protein [Bacteroidales bacterium]|jgi:carbonic anhydrase/acetyltransferase-like protein (isoleucine patch superfamily)|nr:gamma carbonic anhydrase family protein [Bacteroidales bacterium]
MIKELKGFTPKIGKNTFIAETAAIIGDVEMGEDCSIWYGAVLRGDVGAIRLGDRVNVQECATFHGTYNVSTCEVGNDVSVGHNAIVHGAKVGNNVLIGMGAILMDNAVIPDNTIIGAGAFVPSNAVLEPGVWVGSPVKKIKEGSEQIAAAAKKNAEGYLTYKKWYTGEE